MPKDLQELMGHNDMATTMTHYAHVKKQKLASLVATAGSLTARA